MTTPPCPVREISATLQRWLEEGSPIIGFIRNPRGLIRALRDLESLSDNLEIKNAIVAQLKDYLVTHSQGRTYTGKMHAVFSGSPGIGKSTMAKIVARVWFNLGLPRGAVELPPPIVPAITSDLSVDIVDLATDLGRLTTQLSEVKSDHPRWEDIDLTCHRINKTCHDVIDMIRPVAVPPSECEPEESIPVLPLPYLLPEEEDEACYALVGREDFVGSYQGHTSMKTTEFLRANRGKIIIIEEAYQLCLGQHDAYGPEALTLINRAMDECEDDFIFMFNGYTEKLRHTIFAAQPGLMRRIQWRFDMTPYGIGGLNHIFQQQMRKSGYEVNMQESRRFFESYFTHFPAFGGDTERLANHCRIVLSEDEFKRLISNAPSPQALCVGRDLMNRAFEEYKRCDRLGNEPPPHLYGHSPFN